MRIRDHLFRGVDPYYVEVGGSLALWSTQDVEIEGWGDGHLLAQLFRQFMPKLVIEVGTWKGRSAIRLANEAKNLNHRCEIVCVDTFLGSSEHWLDREHGFFNQLDIKLGRPTLYETFIKNVIDHKVTDYITPLPLPSRLAAMVLKPTGLMADLIYIDGAHDYDSVLEDLTHWSRILSPNGIILCDDYGPWPGVERAIFAFCTANPDFRLSTRTPQAILSRTHLF